MVAGVVADMQRMELLLLAGDILESMGLVGVLEVGFSSIRMSIRGTREDHDWHG